jgi:hypothetical protein
MGMLADWPDDRSDRDCLPRFENKEQARVNNHQRLFIVKEAICSRKATIFSTALAGNAQYVTEAVSRYGEDGLMQS